MRIFTGNGKVLRVAVIALLVVMAMPAISMAKNGKGRGRGRSFDRSDRFDRKCDKFVNCHDARDGRWDGRGPRRRLEERRSRRFRDRDFDDDERRFQRRRFRNRDFDDDDFRRQQRRRFLMEQYRNDRYYNNYNPNSQRGFNWTDLLYLFMQ